MALYGEYGNSCELCGCQAPGVEYISEENGDYIPFIVQVSYRYQDSVNIEDIEAIKLNE